MHNSLSKSRSLAMVNIFMKKQLKLPEFKDEDEEREFWDKIDLSDYFEASDFVRVSFPNLKPTSPERFKKITNSMKRDDSIKVK